MLLVGIIAFGWSWVYSASLETPPPSYTSHSVLILEHAGDTGQYLALGRTFGDLVAVKGSDGVITLSVTSNSEFLASEHVDRVALRLKRITDNLREAQREGHVREYGLYKQAIIEITGEEPGRLPYDLTSRRLVLGRIVSIGDPVTAQDDPVASFPRDNPFSVSLALGAAVIVALSFAVVGLTNARSKVNVTSEGSMQ